MLRAFHCTPLARSYFHFRRAARTREHIGLLMQIACVNAGFFTNPPRFLCFPFYVRVVCGYLYGNFFEAWRTRWREREKKFLKTIERKKSLRAYCRDAILVARRGGVSCGQAFETRGEIYLKIVNDRKRNSDNCMNIYAFVIHIWYGTHNLTSDREFYFCAANCSIY